MSPDLLQPLQIFSQLVVQTVGQDLEPESEPDGENPNTGLNPQLPVSKSLNMVKSAGQQLGDGLPDCTFHPSRLSACSETSLGFCTGEDSA